MKIAIIGVARSKTTVLTESLKQKNPHLKCLYEIYTYLLKDNVSLEKITDILEKKDDYIVKILSHNIFGYENNIDTLNLNMYDNIYVIERPNFFDQCCSLQVAKDSAVWHQRGNLPKYNDIKNKVFSLELDTILYQAKGVSTFLKMKQYLIDKNISFMLQPYHDAFDNVPTSVIQNANLDYTNLIRNYYLKNQVQTIFENNFNYESLKNDYEGFCKQLVEVVRFELTTCSV